jgi:hypothetical protein
MTGLVIRSLIRSLLVILSLLSAQRVALADKLVDYKGTIGNAGIGMTLYLKDQVGSLLAPRHVTGTYFYHQWLQDIRIEGDCDGKRGIILYEYNPAGDKVAVIKGAFPEADPGRKFGSRQLQDEVIAGTWQKVDGQDNQPFYASMILSGNRNSNDNRYAAAGVEDPKAFEKKVQKFKNAVIVGDRNAVAGMIAYPLTVRDASELVSADSKTHRICNSKDFLKNYDSIFSKRYVEAIKESIPHNMFARYDGIALGEIGEVWFNAAGKVVTLNH